MSESVILCEGYHDRAFWAGWLTFLGCTDPGERPGGSGRIPVSDPWNAKVSSGHFAYHSRSGKFLRIVPCHGKNNILRFAESRLKDRQQRQLVRLVLSVDSDVPLDSANAASSALTERAVEALLKRLGPAKQGGPGEFVLDDGATIVSLVPWQSADASSVGVPDQQTLERLVCSALVAAYPKHGRAVQDWLDSRPAPAPTGPKEFAWSYMAGQYAEFGCDTFLRKLWLDDRVAAELKSRLTQSGAWRVAEALAE